METGTLTAIDFTYDAQGRLTTITQGARQSTSAYDARRRPITLTDALSRQVRFTYDAADRVLTQTLPDDRVITFSYDANGNVTAITPPGRPAHTFTYTPIDFAASYAPPAVPGTGGTAYRYNRDKQLIGIDRPDGQLTTLAYGATSGRLETVTFSRGTLTFGYDTAGRLASLGDPGGVGLAYTYDGPLPLTETWSGAVTGTVRRTYNNHFEVTSERVNGAFEVLFEYDDFTHPGALLRAGDLTIGYFNGLVTGTSLFTTADSYDVSAFGEPIEYAAWVGDTEVFRVDIVRDPIGRIAQRTETVDGITRVAIYGYDAAGRLTAVSGTVAETYSYDSNGNRLSATRAQQLLGEGTYDDQDRLLTYGGAAYTYTANGDLATKTIGGQTTTYQYDSLGNLTRVEQPHGTVITYQVDGRGRRVGKSVNGTPVQRWLYSDQLRIVAEVDGTGAVVSRFVYGAKPNVPEYMVRDGVTYRIFSDHLGSPRVVINATTGEVVQRMDFRSFGEVYQDSNPGFQPFGFAGGLYDRDTGLVRFGDRDFDASTGRWTVKDPIGFRGRDPNLYGYVLSDPVNFIDPSGRDLVDAGVGAAGGFVGGVIGSVTEARAQGESRGVLDHFAAGLRGAAAGAVAGAISVGGTKTVGAVVGGLAGLYGSVVGQLASGSNCINWGAVAASTAAGAAAGFKTAGLLGLLPSSTTNRVLAGVSGAMVNIAGDAVGGALRR